MDGALAAGIALWLALAMAISWSAFRALWATPTEPAPRASYGGAHVLGAALLMILMLSLEGAAIHYWFAPGPEGEIAEDVAQGKKARQLPPAVAARKFVAMMAAMALGNVVLVVVVVLGLRAAGVSPRQLGLSLEHFTADVRLGLIGFFAVAPPTLALQALLRWAFPDAVSQHEVERRFAGLLELNDVERFTGFVAVFWAVGIMAPIAEELLFRVLLQGWAARAIDRWRRWGAEPTVSAPNEPLSVDQPLTDAQAARVTDPSAEGPNPYQTPAAAVPQTPAEPQEYISRFAARTALIFASLLFAAAHFTQWPDPIPLFVFSCGLGALYARTHRWLPSVVMHAALNTFSLAMLCLALAVGQAK